MSKGSPIYQRISEIVKEVIDEIQQNTPNTDPEFGSVTLVNDDGTVNVQTTVGANYNGVGAATIMTIGTQVAVITADGAKVAIPRGSQTVDIASVPVTKPGP
jgi:hypothetical protein